MLRVKLLSSETKAPYRATSGSAGYDLYACLKEDVFLLPGDRKLIPTEICVQLPEGCYGRIAPRSGNSLKGLDIGGGVIDADYRGPLGIIVINNSSSTMKISHHSRIAQLILERILTPEVEIVESLDSTQRGAGGFGSTGN